MSSFCGKVLFELKWYKSAALSEHNNMHGDVIILSAPSTDLKSLQPKLRTEKGNESRQTACVTLQLVVQKE